MRVGVLAVSRTVLHPALGSADILIPLRRRVLSRPELSLACFLLGRFCRVCFVTWISLRVSLQGVLSQGRAFFSLATRFATGRVTTGRFAERRVFSSLSAAFAITLSFFRGRGFTVYKRKLRDEQSNDCKNHTTQGQRNQTLVQNNPRSNCRNYGHQIDIHARHY